MANSADPVAKTTRAKIHRRRPATARSALCAAAAIGLCADGSPARAATDYFVGTAASANGWTLGFSAASGTKTTLFTPAAGDTLVFDQNSPTTSVDDVASLTGSSTGSIGLTFNSTSASPSEAISGTATLDVGAVTASNAGSYSINWGGTTAANESSSKGLLIGTNTWNLTAGATLTVAGPFNAYTGSSRTLTKTGGGTLALNNAVVAGSSYVVLAQSAGLTQLGGTANDVLGIASISSGATVQLTASNVIFNGTSSVTTGSQGINGLAGTLDLNGFSNAVGRFNGTGTTGVVTNTGTAASTLTIGQSGTTTSTGAQSYAGTITDNNAKGGSLAIVVNSSLAANVFTFSGANTYAGGTTITAGTLTVANTTGSATGTGAVALNGGTLASGAVGTIGGNLVAGSAATIIAPGGVGTVGTLAVGGLTTTSGTTLNFDLATASAGTGEVTTGDLFNVGAGTVAIGSGTTLNFSAGATTVRNDYRLFGGTGVASLATVLANFTLPTAPAGESYSLSSTVDPSYIDLVVGGPPPLNLTWNNTGGSPADGATWDAAQQNFQNGSAGAVAFSNLRADNVTFNDANNGHYAVTIPGTVTPGSTTVTTANTYTFSGAGGIGGGGGLNVNGGAGTLVLQNANTFTGATSVGAGSTLDLQNALALGGSTLTSPAGTVVFDAAVTANAFTLGGLSGTGTLSLQNSAATPAAIVLSVGANGTSSSFSGTLTGAGGLTKVGTGTLTLAGSNGYAGPTTISAGTLAVGSATALPAATTVQFAGTSTLDLAGTVGATVAQVNVSSGVTGTVANGTLRLAAGGGIVFPAAAANTSVLAGTTGVVALNGGGTIDASAALNSAASGIKESISAQISGTGPLVIRSYGDTSDTGNSNTSLFALTNASNNFTGGVTIATGLLNVAGGDGVLGNAAVPGTNAVTIAAGAGLVSNASVTLNTSSYVLSGAGDHFVRGYNLATITLNGVISQSTPGAGLHFTDSGSTVLAGANTYTGPTTLGGTGTLTVAANGTASAGPLGVNSDLTLNASSGGLNLNGFNVSVGSLAGGGTGGKVALGAGSLTLTGGTAASPAYAGVISGTGRVIFNGNVTQGLAGNSTYSGGTTIAAGTLQANNGTSSLGTGPVVVNGGVLAGTGGTTGTGQVTLAGGTITGGTGASESNALGTLTVGAGGLNVVGGTYVVKLDLADAPTDPTGTGLSVNGTTTYADQLIISGLLSGSGTLAISPVPLSAAPTVGSQYSFVIVDAQGAANVAALNNLTITLPQTDAAGDHYAYAFQSDGSSGGEELLLDVTAAAPEPASPLLVGIAAAPLSLGRRRRMAKSFDGVSSCI